MKISRAVCVDSSALLGAIIDIYGHAGGAKDDTGGKTTVLNPKIAS